MSLGAGSGAVFFSNCPLKCVYCQNADIAHEGFGVEVDADRLSRIFLALQADNAANINLVTGTHYLPWILDALEKACALGLSLPVVWNTSGYESVDSIYLLNGHVDVYLTDFKYAAPSVSDAALRYSGAVDYFEVAQASLDAIFAQVGKPLFDDGGALRRGVVVRHLLLPGRLGESKHLMKHLWERFGDHVLYSVMSQYTPVRPLSGFPELRERTTPEDYEELLDFMDSLGMEDYYWQEGDPAQESFIPPFDATGVLL